MKTITRLLYRAALFEWIPIILVGLLLLYIMQLLNTTLFNAVGEESTPILMVAEFVFVIIVCTTVYCRGVIHWMMWAFRQESVDYYILLSQAKSQGYYPRNNDRLIRFFATTREKERLSEILSLTPSTIATKTVEELNLPIMYRSSPVFRTLLHSIWCAVAALVLWLSIRDEMWIMTGVCVVAVLWILNSFRTMLSEKGLVLVIDMKGITLDDQFFEWQSIHNARATAVSNQFSVEFDFSGETISIPSIVLFNKDCWALLAEIEMVRSVALKDAQ